MDQQLNRDYSNLKCYDIISGRWADESSPRICILQLGNPFVLSLYLQTGLVPSGMPTEHVYAFSICAMRAVCTTHLFHLFEYHNDI
jgi:hypothetical protein